MIIMCCCFTAEEIETQKDCLGVIEESVERNNLALYSFKIHAISFLKCTFHVECMQDVSLGRIQISELPFHGCMTTEKSGALCPDL